MTYDDRDKKTRQRWSSDTDVIPKKPDGFFGVKPVEKAQQKNHTKLNSILVCHASNN